MSDVALRVEGLSKQYQIGAKQEAYKTLRDSLTGVVTAPVRRIRQVMRGEAATGATDSFWALKDVSFDVNHGEVVGIIGRNGAGKSTLLKILSRITKPTKGQARVFGRVGALLEVGTGFHPELSGRENVYLNGAILGMKRAEIDRKFDEIVAFAEMEKFIETPVKHYSSGMGLRLGFAVAAYLEPEILVVDEVLAVGDVEFQRKCLNRMKEVANVGQTVLLVSHNMTAIESLCERVVVLNKGEVVFNGDVRAGISHYLESYSSAYEADVDLLHHRHRTIKGKPVFERLRLLNEDGEATAVFRQGEQVIFELETNLPNQETVSPRIILSLFDSYERRACTFFSDDMVSTSYTLRDRNTIRLIWDRCPLAAGQYGLKLKIKSRGGTTLDEVENVTLFEIQPADIYGTGRVTENRAAGVFIPSGTWEFSDPVREGALGG